MFYCNCAQLEQTIRMFVLTQLRLPVDGDKNFIIGLLKKSRYSDRQIQKLKEMLKQQI